MTDWKPGDVANGHVLGEDNVWRPVDGAASAPTPQPSYPVSTSGSTYAPLVVATNGPATVSLVFGIIALILNLCFIPSLVAVITGVVGLGRAKQLNGLGQNKALWGIGTGAVGAVIAVFLWGTFFSGFSESMDSFSSDDSIFSSEDPSDSSVDPGPQEATVSATAAAMVKEFEDNELAADAKYKGHWVEVSGVVNKIDTDPFNDDKYILQMGSGGAYEFLTVDCSGIPSAELQALSTGQSVTAVGEFEDGGNLGVKLKHCQLK